MQQCHLLPGLSPHYLLKTIQYMQILDLESDDHNLSSSRKISCGWTMTKAVTRSWNSCKLKTSYISWKLDLRKRNDDKWYTEFWGTSIILYIQFYIHTKRSNSNHTNLCERVGKDRREVSNVSSPHHVKTLIITVINQFTIFASATLITELNQKAI